MQNKASVFDKKVLTRVDKKIATWRKKSSDEEKNLVQQTLKKTVRTQRRSYHCGHLRESINVKPKEDPYHCET